MKYVEFRKFTDENGALPVYLFEGEETYFRERGSELLLKRFLKEPTLDFTAFDGGTLKGEKLKALADAVNSFPFLSEKRFIKVTEFYPTEKEYDFYLRPIFENPPKGDEAQQLIGESGYRPTNQDILNRFSNKFDLNIMLWSIEDYGGWNEAYKTYFDDGAMFDEIYGN